ncbi:MAG: biopolymer transport protein ExbB/TolQ [Myxococcota bacterium]|jgi:biopolymer transport protein ExbB/TolQ
MLLFLLESIAHAEEAAPGFTLTELWTHSGFIARSVIVTLILMLIASIFVTIERLIAFNRARNQSMRLAAEIVGPLQAADVDTALKIAGDEQFKAAYLGSLLRAGLRELQNRRDAHGVQNARRAVDKAHSEEIAKMKRGMTVLATTGSTAPFVGLFGTTFGVINAFQGMATAGSGLASISAGISEALITTGIGIGVAVVGVWMFNYFNFRTDKVKDELSSSESDFLDWAEKLIQDPAAMAGK